MKARKIRGLDPGAPLAPIAGRIVGSRLDELLALAPKALREDRVAKQHDLRIAAKRLRYVLELTESCFGPNAAQARRSARQLQGILGDLHDADEMLDRIRLHAGQIGRQSELVAGLVALADRISVGRNSDFERFQEFWLEQERLAIWERLRDELG